MTHTKYIISICLSIITISLHAAQMSKIKVACCAGLVMTAHSLQVMADEPELNSQRARIFPEVTPTFIVRATCWGAIVSLLLTLFPNGVFRNPTL